MSKKLIAALICLIIVLLSYMIFGRGESLEEAEARLILKMLSSPEAVAVFNLDGGVFV